jgi:3-oxoacyl-[acyl-carrier-protein] synthase II
MEKGASRVTIHVVDYDCVTCFGIGHEVLWESLITNQCGVYPVNRFETVNYVNQQAACIRALDEIPHGQRFPALLEMLCRKDIHVSPDTILLTATTKDNIELCEQSLKSSPGNNSPWPAYSMGNWLQQRWGLKAPGQNINTACTSASTAVLWASEMIASGMTDSAIICGADIVSEFVFSGFSALKAMSPSASRPFDSQRDGLILGESAAYIILMSEQRMKLEGRHSHGIVKGWGTSSDATHVTAPDRHGQGLRRAIDYSLKRASVPASLISSINAHGTATVYNDAMEIVAFGAIFAEAIPPLYSIKGAIGHTLGPCGLIEMIVTLISLQKKLIPSTAGLRCPEARVASSMSTRAVTLHEGYALSVNSGFGGSNTALILERV